MSVIILIQAEVLDYFQKLCSNYKDPLKREMILWNNRDITIENKRVFGKAGWDKDFLYKNFLNNQVNYL